MAGRGQLDGTPPIENDSLFMLRNGRWQPLHEPINYDRPFAGISLAASFADEYAKRFGCETGLIPCADGGTSLADWSVGGQLYRHAVSQTCLAQSVSVVKGILWHQGEEDSTNEGDARSYMPRFMEILSALRKDCTLEDVPVIMGELGGFLGDDTEHDNRYFPLVNKALADIAARNPRIALASANGLISKGDNLHFDAESLREFGRRYFQKYLELVS